MGSPLRDRYHPSELASNEQVIEFTDKISEFGRLADILEADLATLEPDKRPQGWRKVPVSGRLAFGFADARREFPALEGRIGTTIDAICQRCLEPFRLPLTVELKLLLGRSADVPAEYEGYDAWELADDKLRPADIVEEALIMAMPLSAMHDATSACGRTHAGASADGQTTRPFAKLKARMEDRN